MIYESESSTSHTDASRACPPFGPQSRGPMASVVFTILQAPAGAPYRTLRATPE